MGRASPGGARSRGGPHARRQQLDGGARLLAVDVVAALALIDGYCSVTLWGVVVFVPLWFLGTHLGVALLAPTTIALHPRAGTAAPALAPPGLAAVAVWMRRAALRARVGGGGPGVVGPVWLFAHQLGYLWRDGPLTGATPPVGVRLAGVGLGALVTRTAPTRLRQGCAQT